jgi:DNA-binding transcriptional ArsR family regulator
VAAYAHALDALGDPTRRSILDLLRAGPRSVGELASDLPVTRPAVSQHLKVLGEARLVTHEKAGTRHIYRLDADGLQDARAWLEAFWSQALAELKAAAEADNPDEGESNG